MKTSIKFTQPSRTRQSEKNECNINNIMAKYEDTGQITHIQNNPGQYGDFSEVPDYHSALNQIKRAQDTFDALPSQIRKRFDNDPGAFVEFVDNPKNNQELINMGLKTAPPGPTEPAKKGGDEDALERPTTNSNKEDPTPAKPSENG